MISGINFVDKAFISVYGPLFVLAFICAKRFTKTSILSYARNTIDLKKHSFLIGFSLIGIWAVIETGLYGAGRIIPSAYPYISAFLPVVVSAKMLGVIGFCFAYHGLKTIDSPEASLKEPFILAIRVWVISFVCLVAAELIAGIDLF